MLQHRFLGLGAALALALSATAAHAQPGPGSPNPGANGPGCVADGAPQAGLPVDSLTILTQTGPVRLTVQIAADEATREKGLMFVRELPAAEGMIFDFHQPQATAFWMHNTYIPLDLLFVQADGKIATIAHNAPTCSDAPIPSKAVVRTVIELNAGVAEARGIREGDYVVSQVIYPPTPRP